MDRAASQSPSAAGADRRREARLTMVTKAMLFADGAAPPTRVFLSNISHRGVAFRTPTNFTPGTRYRLKIEAGPLQLNNPLQVIRCKPTPTSKGQYEIGCKFLPYDPRYAPRVASAPSIPRNPSTALRPRTGTSMRAATTQLATGARVLSEEFAPSAEDMSSVLPADDPDLDALLDEAEEPAAQPPAVVTPAPAAPSPAAIVIPSGIAEPYDVVPTARAAQDASHWSLHSFAAEARVASPISTAPPVAAPITGAPPVAARPLPTPKPIAQRPAPRTPRPAAQAPFHLGDLTKLGAITPDAA